MNTGTFDVQGLDIIYNSSNGEICFCCLYVSQSVAKGCFIQYMNLRTSFSGSLSSSRNGGTKCVSDIITGDYNILVYDYESDGEVFTIRPAYQTSTWIRGISYSSTVRLTNDTVSPSPVSGDCTIKAFCHDMIFKAIHNHTKLCKILYFQN